MNAHSNTVEAQNLPDLQQVFDSLDRLVLRLTSHNQRVMINCRGSRDWCRAIADYLADNGRVIVFSNEADLSSPVAFSKAELMLGKEADCVIFDGYSGLQVDVLCMAAGLLCGGGILLLLTPESPQAMEDDYGVWQGGVPAQKFFLQYFFSQLELSQWVVRESDEACRIHQIELEGSDATVFVDDLGEQQAQVLEQMQAWHDKKHQPVFVLTADRGRGKSTLLGRFARQLTEDRTVVITAASKSQLGVLFSQLEAQDADACFMPPDEIIRQARRIDFLIIDEAAMLPARVLARCMALADKTLMATTTGGYEGTGGGFLLKFMRSIAPSRKVHAHLQQPIRWGAQDALEHWMNRVLFLKQTLASPLEAGSAIEIRSIDKEALARNGQLLRAIHSLLVSAHYRTRPSDLRQLMEDENQQIIIATLLQDVVGVVLLNCEGGFSESLSQEIFMGRRRPQGHLLAQMMTAQAGIKSFACLQGLRVQRIAVDDRYRRQGMGRRLIDAAISAAQAQGLDYIGSSFAIDATVLPFWKAMAFEPLHITTGKGVATAQQTVAVLKPLNTHVNKRLSFQREKIQRELPLWLPGFCREMEWQAVLELLKMLKIKYHFNEQDEDELQAFGEGYRGLEYSQALLQRFLISNLYRSPLDVDDTRLAIEKILQNRNWQSVSQCGGKKEGLNRLRKIIAGLRE